MLQEHRRYRGDAQVNRLHVAAKNYMVKVDEHATTTKECSCSISFFFYVANLELVSGNAKFRINIIRISGTWYSSS